jgi:hypothetical protein
MIDQTDLCPTCGGSGKHPLVYLARHGEGRINVASSETRSTSMSHEPKNASYPAKEVRTSHVSEGVSERSSKRQNVAELTESITLCPDCGHKLRERTHPLIHCAAPPGRCFCRGWILRKPPKELSERGLHTTETVADGSIAHNTENSVLPDSPPCMDVKCASKDHYHMWSSQMQIEDSPPPLQESERIRRAAMNIVNQLGDLWAIPVADRQQGNDKADDFTAAIIASETDRARAEGARAELEIIYEMINSRKMSAVKFRVKDRLAALDKQEPRK